MMQWQPPQNQQYYQPVQQQQPPPQQPYVMQPQQPIATAVEVVYAPPPAMQPVQQVMVAASAPPSNIIYNSMMNSTSPVAANTTDDAPPAYDADAGGNQVEGSSSGAAVVVKPTAAATAMMQAPIQIGMPPAHTQMMAPPSQQPPPQQLDMTPAKVVLPSGAAAAMMQPPNMAFGQQMMYQHSASNQPSMYMPQQPQAIAGTYAQLPPAASAASTGVTAQSFITGKLLTLTSVASGQLLHVCDEKMNVSGTAGAYATESSAQWIIHLSQPSNTNPVIKLESVYSRGRYLRIGPEKGLNAGGDGGPFTEFIVYFHPEDGTISLQSNKWKQAGSEFHVGVLPTGQRKAPMETGQGPHGRFKAALLK